MSQKKWEKIFRECIPLNVKVSPKVNPDLSVTLKIMAHISSTKDLFFEAPAEETDDVCGSLSKMGVSLYLLESEPTKKKEIIS